MLRVLRENDHGLPQSMSREAREGRVNKSLHAQAELHGPDLDRATLDEHVQMGQGRILGLSCRMDKRIPMLGFGKLEKRENDFSTGLQDSHALFEVEVGLGMQQVGEETE